MQKSRVAAAVLGIEGAAGTVAGIGFVIAAVAGHPSDRGTAVLLGVLVALYGAAIVFIARGVDRSRAWARTPAFLVQFFALVIAWYQRDSLPAVTASLALVAVAAGVGFVIAALVGHPSDRATGVLLGVLLALYGAGIVHVGRGLDRQQSWARTPAFLVQFFALVVAWYQRDTLPAVTAALAVVAVVAVVVLARAHGAED